MRRPCRTWLLAAIVLVALQAVLPGLHILIDHCPQPGHVLVASVASGTVIQAADADDDDEGHCPICAMLHALGQVAPPLDEAPPTSLVAPPSQAIVLPAFTWVQDPPDVRCSPPRGPPAA